MASRLFWIALTGLALVLSTVMQGQFLFDWGNDKRSDRHWESRMEARAERDEERRFASLRVVDGNGDRIRVSRETRKEMGKAVKRLVAAEMEAALADARDDGAAAREAHKRSDEARSEIETLKAQIRDEQHRVRADRESERDQIRREVRETIRSAVRD